MNKETFSDTIIEISRMKNLKNDFINKNKGGRRQVYLYGAGHACEFFKHHLEKNGVKIKAIIDGDMKKWGKKYEDLTIVSIEQVINDTTNGDCASIVISAPSLRKEISAFLAEKMPDAEVYSFDVEIYEYCDLDVRKYSEWLIDNIDSLYEIYTRLADEKSRYVMLNVIKARVTANLDFIDEINEDNQYWPNDIIEFGDNERMIECGSCDGATLKEMVNMVNGKFDHIYCLEPDLDCKEALLSTIKQLDPEGKRISYIPKGTSNKTGKLYFKRLGVDSGLSKISEDGEFSIDVTALDDLGLKNITYVKMDIEGAELATLHGTKNMIDNDKPKMAVCVYHRMDDILTIPEYLIRINPGYKLYMRHHNCNITETVLYAV